MMAGDRGRILWHCLLALAGCLAFWVALSVPCRAQETEQADASEDDRTWIDKVSDIPVTGYLSTRYRLRWTGDESDQDLITLLSLDMADPDRHPVTAHIMLRGSADLDGDRDSDEFFVFDSIEDSFDHAVNGRFYQGYLDFHRVKSLDLLRVGRQSIYETPEYAHFDGVRAETPEFSKQRWKLGAYGGVPVHLNESSPNGDFLFGAFGQARPWKGARVRLDWMYARDDTRFEDHQDNLLGLSIWQKVDRNTELHGHYTRLEGDERDLLLRASYQDPDEDLRVQASYYGLLQKQKNFALEFDPYYGSLHEYFPYHQVSLVASKGFGDHLVVDGGIQVRQLSDDDDESSFNREFERYYLTPTVVDFPAEGWSAGLTGELWDTDDQDIETLGIDITREFDERLKASVGTYYSLFKYDLYQDRERDDVRTYYLRIDYRWSDSWRLHAVYEYEEDDFDEYSTLKVGALWSF